MVALKVYNAGPTGFNGADALQSWRSDSTTTTSPSWLHRASANTNAVSSTLPSTKWVALSSGTLRNLYIMSDGGLSTMTLTVQVNGIDTSLTASVNSTSFSTSSDTTHSVSVSAGDEITLKATISPATAHTQPSGTLEFAP
jgi:hypothetical protein